MPVRANWGRARARHAERGPARTRDPRPHSSHSGGRGVHERTSRPAPPFPLAAPPRTRGKGAREGTPPTAPPFPICAEWSTWDTPPPSPSLPAPRPRRHVREGTPPPAPLARKGGARGHAAPAPPFDRAALYARERGTRWYATAGPTLPIRAEGVCTRARRPVHAGKGRARARDRRPHPSHPRGRGAHEGHDAPVPLGRPAPYSADRWHARASRPHPVAPHSRGKGRTRPPASLRVAQQGRRNLRVPAFTAPSPRFRAP
ncbi:hypothetical protein EDB89DRAFT_2077002 [Lactarius sanguifluus]|nr:hypothetical protein EDB89DRAFT_2077002 [Lactarius sanguifluus]